MRFLRRFGGGSGTKAPPRDNDSGSSRRRCKKGLGDEVEARAVWTLSNKWSGDSLHDIRDASILLKERPRRLLTTE